MFTPHNIAVAAADYSKLLAWEMQDLSKMQLLKHRNL